MDAIDILRRAAAHHQRGEFVDAEPLYRQAIALNPSEPVPLHLLGMLMTQSGRVGDAIHLLAQAVALSPKVSMFHNDLGNALRAGGRVEEAVVAFQTAVSLDASSVPAVANLGNALGDVGRFGEAVAACEKAVELAPESAITHSDLGVALAHADRLTDALNAHEQAVAIDARSAILWSNYASTLHAAGCNGDAENACRRALAIDPRSVESMNNLAVCRLQNNDAGAAIALLREAIRLRPDYADAHNNLGNALCAAGLPTDAEIAARRAVALKPSSSDAHNNLATALRDQGRSKDAMVECDAAVALQPLSPAAHTNRGVCLADDARFGEAVAAYQHAIDIDPGSVAAHTNLAAAWAALGARDRCLAAARRAIAIDPSHAAAHTNLGLMLLTFGQFEEGWAEHEWRWRANPKARRRDFRPPQWDGSTLDGRTILLHAEQGFGDGIQFMRYAPLVAERGGRVLLEVPPELHRLAESLTGVTQVISYGQPLPKFDVHCPLMSLPRAMGTRIDAVPVAVPYVHASADLVAKWAERLRDRVSRPAEYLGIGRRLGLVWAGRPSHSNDRNRSMSFTRLAPLLQLPDVMWVSLQRGPAARELESIRFVNSQDAGSKVHDLGNEACDFADTAALLSNLDAVVSVDSAVAHLAGAMGVPTWLMLPRVADWRWMIDRDDTPWYPRHRLVRQRVSGDWESVISNIAAQLR